MPGPLCGYRPQAIRILLCTAERLLFRRQAICFYLRLISTTRHLLCFHIHVGIRIPAKGYDRGILLLFPRCQLRLRKTESYPSLRHLTMFVH